MCFAGVRTSKNGYDGLVEVAAVAYRKFNPNQQRDVVIQSLEKAFPRPILNLASFVLFLFFIFFPVISLLLFAEALLDHLMHKPSTFP